MRNVCSVDGCDRFVKGHGFCKNHYRQWRKHGDPLTMGSQRYDPDATCAVEDCDRRPYCRGWCRIHHGRWERHGDPLVRLRVPLSESSHGWKGDAVQYRGAHLRVAVVRGRASDFACVDCGGQAADWSFNYTGRILIDVTRREGGKEYSGDPADYSPRCRSCHKIFDFAHARASSESTLTSADSI